MHGVWETFKEAGFIAWPILLAGILGIGASVGALILTVMRSRTALWLGVVAALLGALAAGLGGLGVVRGRAATDAALAGESVRAGMKERIRHQGYLEARGAAKIGLFFAMLPLFAGIGAMFASPRGRSSAAPSASPMPPAEGGEGSGLGVPIGVTCAGMLGVAFALVGMNASIPGRDLPHDDPIWKCLDDVDAVQSATDRDDVIFACDSLAKQLEDEARYVDEASVPGLGKAEQRCAEALRQRALELQKHLVRSWLGKLKQSRIAKDTPGMVDTLDKDIAALGEQTDFLDPFNLPDKSAKPKIRMGTPTVSGRLPPEVIQRIVRQQLGRFSVCYTANAKGRPLEGTVKTRFVIARDGAVSDVADQRSELPEPLLVSCVTRVYYGMSFPQPEGGIVTVTYPITFSPPDVQTP